MAATASIYGNYRLITRNPQCILYVSNYTVLCKHREYYIDPGLIRKLTVRVFLIGSVATYLALECALIEASVLILLSCSS